MSMLTDVLPAKVRKIVYWSYAFAGLLIGATQVGFMSATDSSPKWLLVVLAVYGYLGVPLGATAGSNVKDPSGQK